MARSRNIKPAFFMNELLACLAHWVRLLLSASGPLPTAKDGWKITRGESAPHCSPTRPGFRLTLGLTNWTDADSSSVMRSAESRSFRFSPGASTKTRTRKRRHQSFRHVLTRQATEQATEKPRLVAEMPRRTAETPGNYTAHSNVPDFSGIGEATETPERATEITRLVAEFPERAGLIPSNLIPDSLTLVALPVSRKQPGQQDAELVNAFDSFIARYPNRIGIDEACRQWISLVGNDITEVTLPEVMAGLNRWIASEQWRGDNGKYIPAPAKWLQNRRWKDAPRPADEGFKPPAASSAGIDANAEWIPPWKAEAA